MGSEFRLGFTGRRGGGTRCRVGCPGVVLWGPGRPTASGSVPVPRTGDSAPAGPRTTGCAAAAPGPVAARPADAARTGTGSPDTAPAGVGRSGAARPDAAAHPGTAPAGAARS